MQHLVAPPPPPLEGSYIPAGLLTPENLYDYQRECVLHMLYHDDSMLWLQMGLGKEQPHSEPVLTPDGWSTMGDIRPGAHVIGSDGRPVKVLAKFPQGEKEVVKVTFNDGSWTLCGWDHLFTVYSEHQRFKGLPGTARTVRDLHDSGLTKRNGKNGTMLKWSIPLVAPVQFPAADLPIEPYTLGVLLGDGHTSEGSGVTLCTDIETLHRVGATCIKPHETSAYCGYGYLPGLKQKLRDVDLLGKRSWEKFVPTAYMHAAVPQRLSLLQGLLDADGSPIDKGGVEFSSASEALADAVVELSNSLGGIARKKGPRVTRHQNGEGRPSWRVNVKLPSDMSPFTLSRKLAKWVRPTKYHALRKIASIEPCGYREESSCILVDAPDHLYVTRHHVVTHNTPITLTTVVDRMRAGQVRKTLIFGPLRVIQAVWAREARKWSHTRHLRFSVLHGTKEKRTRALFSDADIYLCNYEAMNWLAETLDHYYLSQGKPLPFEMCVYDEVSKMKNSTSLRMSGGNRDRKDRRGEVYKIKVVGWRKILPHFKYRVGLTGTPASNGYLDLHGQYLAVDGGKRLGEYITHFKDSYFTSDYNGWKYTPTEIGKQWIEYQISDITKKMDAADYLDLPECRTINVMVDLPPKARKAYDEMEKAMFTQLETGSEVEVFSRSSVSNKCLQFCIAEGTEVLTDSGWKPIEQFQEGDKVWDGIEWASVYSLAFQGIKKVVECDGVYMTPDHKVLTVSGWVEAEKIIDGDATNRFNRAPVRLPNSINESGINRGGESKSDLECSLHLREGVRSNRSEPPKPEPTRREVVRLPTRRSDTPADRISRDDEDAAVCNMEEHALSLREPKRQGLQKLWCKGYHSLRALAEFLLCFLGRYERHVQGSLDDRKDGQQRRVPPGELPMEGSPQAAEQHSQQHPDKHTDGRDHGDASCSQVRTEGRDHFCSTSQGVAGSGTDRTTEEKTAKVYDLINAGTRNRFTVRGKNGEVLIVHNCNGTPYYGETQEWEALHDAKLDALEDILEEAAGAPVLCSYTFKSDAERILKKFKKYNPVNLTAVPSKDTEKYIDKWNRGEIKLLIGHPACLHPSTQVLTELRGWIKIVDVTPADRVFDGVEFVNHDGCSYSGYKDVIDTFGITMTPDHKLLIGNEWVEARDVGDSEEIRRKALYQYEGDDSRIGEMFTLQDGVQDYSSKCSEAQSAESDTLPTLCGGSVSQYDWHQDSQDLVRSEVPNERPIGSKLCGPWHRNVRRVAGLLKVLRRHVAWVRGSSDDRAKGCERPVLEGQLRLGYSVRPARQQANNPAIDLPGGGNPLGRIGAPVRCQQDDVDHATQSRDDRRRSSARCAELPLREKSQPKEHRTSKREKAHVYDIVNCGPRHQFLIRNDDGEMFISHNSMGHGVDGLQKSGSILVWFGVNWSLELYEQMNGRLDRQGQKSPVSIIRILCRDSVDLAVADAIERKVDDQEGLKAALQRYRDGVTTNDLEVNFF